MTALRAHLRGEDTDTASADDELDGLGDSGAEDGGASGPHAAQVSRGAYDSQRHTQYLEATAPATAAGGSGYTTVSGLSRDLPVAATLHDSDTTDGVDDALELLEFTVRRPRFRRSFAGVGTAAADSQVTASTSVVSASTAGASITADELLDSDDDEALSFRIAPQDRRSIIGRGAFGCVFHGIELATLRSVAVKVIQLGPAVDPGSPLYSGVASGASESAGLGDAVLSAPSPTATATTTIKRGRGGAAATATAGATTMNTKQALEEELTEEGRLMASVEHPNVVRCFGAAVLEARCMCLVMEYCSGGTLRGLIERFAPLPVAVATRVAKEVTAALVAIHATGLVHCDLKLENVLLRDDGSIAVADFGCARMAALGDEMPFGTPEYMSPEAVRTPGELDAKRDVWALGCCIVTLFTGVLAWAHRGFRERVPLMYHIGSCQPDERPFDNATLERLPPVVAAVVLDCFLHDAKRRPSAEKILPLLDL